MLHKISRTACSFGIRTFLKQYSCYESATIWYTDHQYLAQYSEIIKNLLEIPLIFCNYAVRWCGTWRKGPDFETLKLKIIFCGGHVSTGWLFTSWSIFVWMQHCLGSIWFSLWVAFFKYVITWWMMSLLSCGHVILPHLWVNFRLGVILYVLVSFIFWCD